MNGSMNGIGTVINFYKFVTLALIGAGVAGFFLLKKTPQKENEFPLIKEDGYFIPLPIYGYSRSNAPFVEVKIENKTIPAIIDLGFQGMLSLPPSLLKNIGKKKLVEQTRDYGWKGVRYINNVYELDEIQVGIMAFSNIMVKEKSLESMNENMLTGEPPLEYHYGSIGWELFTEYNLLVDCKQYILALCDSLKTLKLHQYPVESFIETSLISPDLLIIEASTEEGVISCLLDTGCTVNMLIEDPENEDSCSFDREDIQEFSSFKIEGKEFGPITYHRIKSPFQFDVILGMEFFDSHVVFIDFDDKKVHIAPYPKETWPKPNLRPTIGPMRFHSVF